MTADTAAAPAQVDTKRFPVFLTIWAGQFVSLIGSELTAYALGVWAYQRTGSATAFTLIMVFAQLPIVLLAPIMGAYVDRWDRRRTLIGANALAAAAVGTLALLVLTGHFQLWFIYPTIGLVAVANALHWPAFATLPPLTVPKKHMARAAGMVELSSAVAKTIAPSLATLLVGLFALAGVLLSDMTSFLIAIAALLVVRIVTPERKNPKKSSIRADIREGWTYLTDRPGLVRLLLFFLVNNLFVVFPLVLAVPLVASFATGGVLAAIMSASAAGLIAGGVVMSVWGGPKTKVYGVIGAGAVLGLSSLVAGLRPAPVLVAVALFCFSFAVPVLNGCSQAIWQLKVAPQVQGRIFALRRTVATATAPVGFLASGPLADYVFEPLMRTGGPLAGTVGQILGAGHGRGIGLEFVVFGLACVAVAIWGVSSRRLTHLETDLPDETGTG
ncbi:MFS transporter [Fodinicola acaciae]|uniref:MFS transporter n=1 Tax=Fodinicola acaciae TaxID=2681555 RepID=UPI0013D018D5|nr:MFS transporter [Fodinicola acaciae]